MTPTFLTATQWGMRWARPPQVERLGDPECYVHHTAGAHPALAVEAFRQLNEYAINVKGYSAVDYDILVHRNPFTGEVTIGEARGSWRSAATLDRNEEGEAVCLLGYFHPGSKHSRQPHPDEVEGVARAIVWGIDKGWIAKTARILGHRDNPAHPRATTCPGDYLYAQLPTIRARVAALLNPAPPPPPPPKGVVTMVFLKRAGGTANSGWTGLASFDNRATYVAVNGAQWANLIASGHCLDWSTFKAVLGSGDVTWVSA